MPLEFINTTYPSINGSNASGMADLMTWSNDISGGGLGIAILFTFFIIGVGSLTLGTNLTMRRILPTMFFITTIISQFLHNLKMIDSFTFYFLVIMTILTTIWLMFSKDEMYA